MSHPGVKSVIFFFLGECVNHYVTSFGAYFHNTNLSPQVKKQIRALLKYYSVQIIKQCWKGLVIKLSYRWKLLQF